MRDTYLPVAMVPEAPEAGTDVVAHPVARQLSGRRGHWKLCVHCASVRPSPLEVRVPGCRADASGVGKPSDSHPQGLGTDGLVHASRLRERVLSECLHHGCVSASTRPLQFWAIVRESVVQNLTQAVSLMRPGR